MIRFGRISEIDADKARVKVSFGEDGIESGWLPTLHAGTKGNSYFHTYNVNELVACAMEENLDAGVCLGSIYYKDEQPVESGPDLVSVVFDSNNKVVFNRQSGEMQIKASGGVNITGDVTITGSLDASGDVTAGPTNVSLTGHTHQVTGVQPGSGSVVSQPPT
jgi:phage baseplate assembly protein gpV